MYRYISPIFLDGHLDHKFKSQIHPTWSWISLIRILLPTPSSGRKGDKSAKAFIMSQEALAEDRMRFPSWDILGLNERSANFKTLYFQLTLWSQWFTWMNLHLSENQSTLGCLFLPWLMVIFFQTIFHFRLLKVHRTDFQDFPKVRTSSVFLSSFFNPLRVWFKSKGPEEMDRIHQNHFGCDPGAAKRQKKIRFASIWGSFLLMGLGLVFFFFFFSGGLGWMPVGCRLDGLDRLGVLFPKVFSEVTKGWSEREKKHQNKRKGASRQVGVKGRNPLSIKKFMYIYVFFGSVSSEEYDFRGLVKYEYCTLISGSPVCGSVFFCGKEACLGIPSWGTNISPHPRHVWRWFSFPQGGMCEFPGGCIYIYIYILLVRVSKPT